jgi:hypothetical protein
VLLKGCEKNMMRNSLIVRGLVLGFVFAAVACGGSSDDDGSGGSGGGGGSGGSGGSTAQIDPDCVVSMCPKAVQAYAEPSACSTFKANKCFPEEHAWIECNLANEKCDPDGSVMSSSIAVCDDLEKTALDCLMAGH